MRAREPHPDDLPNHRTTEEAESAASKLFDLRTIIAILFAFYGIILTIMGLFFVQPGDLEMTGGININLWSGLAMVGTAAGFFAWARARPLAPPPQGAEVDRPPMPH